MFWLAILALGSQTPEASAKVQEFASYAGTDTRIEVVIPTEKSPTPKTSPKNRWLFDWVVQGLGRLPGGGYSYVPRFRVFSQVSPEEGKAPAVARMAMRLWDFNFQRLRLDHALLYNDQVIDYYLCRDGKPGGEQLFAEDADGGYARKVDTIYIYDMAGFTDPVEMAREVAHEYGHATLPPVGGYREPEYWADGYLGEKLFLRWFRDAMAAGGLTPEDAMGAGLPALDSWVKANVDPLVAHAALTGPNQELLASKRAGAMDAFMGLVLYVDCLVPAKVAARSLKLIGSTKAVDYPAAAVAAVEEAQPFTMKLPAGVAGKISNSFSRRPAVRKPGPGPGRLKAEAGSCS